MSFKLTSYVLVWCLVQWGTSRPSDQSTVAEWLANSQPGDAWFEGAVMLNTWSSVFRSRCPIPRNQNPGNYLYFDHSTVAQIENLMFCSIK